MVSPWMDESLIFIPKPVCWLGLAILLLAALKEYRQGYIGRIGIAANAFLLWQIFFSAWNTLPEWFQWYLNVGTIVAITAMISYVFKESLPSEFYDFCYIFYGSLTVLFAIVVAYQAGVPLI